MKPILFPAGQTAFNTNGLGRLHDAISCVVTESGTGATSSTWNIPSTGIS